MNLNYRIIDLNYNDKNFIKEVANIHLNLLPESPLSILGFKFLSDFYYSNLIKDNLIKCKICLINNEVAGFLSYTIYAKSFIKKSIKKHLFKLLIIIACVFLKNPLSIIKVIKMLKEIKNKNNTEYCELLSFAVKPQYWKMKNNEEKRISIDLFEKTITEIKNKNINEVFLSVMKSNIGMLFFYKSYGVEHIGYTNNNNSLLLKLKL